MRDKTETSLLRLKRLMEKIQDLRRIDFLKKEKRRGKDLTMTKVNTSDSDIFHP